MSMGLGSVNKKRSYELNWRHKMFRLILASLLFFFIVSSQSWAMGFLKPRADAGISIQVDNAYIKNSAVKKDDKFFYIYGNIIKPFGRDFNGITVIVSLLNAQGQEIDQGKSRISFISSSRSTLREGSFFVKVKYNLKIVKSIIKVKL